MFHGVPNLGDVTTVDWSGVPDIESPGYSKRLSFYDLKHWSNDEVRAHPNSLPSAMPARPNRHPVPFTTDSCN